MADEVLTREIGLRDGITPTGRKLVPVPDPQRGMYWIRYADGKGGQLPAQVAGAYTGLTRAEVALKEFLEMFWDLSDAASRKTKVTSNVIKNADG